MATIKLMHKTVKGEKVLDKGILREVFCMYTKVAFPGPIFDQKDWPNPTLFEYKVDLVVDEDTADEWDALFLKQPAKKYLKADFMKRYRIESDADFPEGLSSSSKKYWVISLKQAKNYMDKKTNTVKDLSSSLRPRISIVEGNKPVDHTMKTKLGNGTKADVMFIVNQNKQYGQAAKLALIKVTNLVEAAESSNEIDDDMKDFLGGDMEIDESEYEQEAPARNTQQDDEDQPPFDTEGDFEDEDEEFDEGQY